MAALIAARRGTRRPAPGHGPGASRPSGAHGRAPPRGGRTTRARGRDQRRRTPSRVAVRRSSDRLAASWRRCRGARRCRAGRTASWIRTAIEGRRRSRPSPALAQRARSARRPQLAQPASVTIGSRRRRPVSVATAAAGRRQVHLLGVLVEHPGRREPPDRASRSSAHEARSRPRGTPVVVALVVARHDLVLEEPVEVLGVGPVLGALVGVRLAAADRPAVVAGPALVPPAVEDADVDDAVLRPPSCPHVPTPRAAGAGCSARRRRPGRGSGRSACRSPRG